MAKVRSREVSTSIALTILLNRLLIGEKPRVSDVQTAPVSQKSAVASYTGRQNAVKKVNTLGNSFKKVLRGPHPH